MKVPDFILKQINIKEILHDAIQQIHPEDLAKIATETVKHELELLKGDADKNGIIDSVQAEAYLAAATDNLHKLFELMKKVHETHTVKEGGR